MKKIELILWHSCNTPCIFCSAGDSAGRAMSVEAAAETLAGFRERGARAVDFGGGEPSIHPDIIKLAGLARRLGYSSVGLKTNGIRFCYPEFVIECIDAGIDSFSVSVWGQDPETHDYFAGLRGAFEMTEMGIKHMLHYGADVQVDYLLSSRSLEGAQVRIGKFAALGMKKFTLWLFSIFGAGGRLAGMCPSMQDAGAAAIRCAEAAAAHGAVAQTSHIPPCCMDGRGDLFFNVSDYELMIVAGPGHHFMAEESPFEKGRHISVCEDCCFNDCCPGPRIEYAETFGTGEFAAVESPGALS